VNSTIPASVVILTKNEELHVSRAVSSASAFDEVVVVDSASTDQTRELATAAGARVEEFIWDGAYPKKKEWALQLVRNDWVIYLDADEFLSAPLVNEIGEIVRDEDASAIEVPLAYRWLGKTLRHGHRVKKRIGMRRSRCEWPRPDDLSVKNMWEVEGHYQPIVLQGKVVALTEKLGHDDQDGLYDYFARHNRYSDWEAAMIDKRDAASHRSRSRMGRIAVTIPFKPVVFFLYSYVARLGFLDGRQGLDYALALAFYYWQIGAKVRELRSMTAAGQQ